MMFNDGIKQFVRVGESQKGTKYMSAIISKEDFETACQRLNADAIRISIFPENEPKVDKTGKSYILGSVAKFEKK